MPILEWSGARTWSLTRAATALGPSDPHCRNAVLATPPPRMGVVSSEKAWSITVEAIVNPVRALVRTLFGLLTISCVTPVRP